MCQVCSQSDDQGDRELSLVDKQIVASLDRIHAERTSNRARPCAWTYDGVKDIYSCGCPDDKQIRLRGSEVISNINNHYPLDNNLDVVIS